MSSKCLSYKAELQSLLHPKILPETVLLRLFYWSHLKVFSMAEKREQRMVGGRGCCSQIPAAAEDKKYIFGVSYFILTINVNFSILVNNVLMVVLILNVFPKNIRLQEEVPYLDALMIKGWPIWKKKKKTSCIGILVSNLGELCLNLSLGFERMSWEKEKRQVNGEFS